jgi:hypothetical protein
VFATLQQRWNRKRVFASDTTSITERDKAIAEQSASAICAKPSPSNIELCDALLHLVDVLVQDRDTGIKAVMITSPHTTFIPSFLPHSGTPKVLFEQFRDTYLSYPSFWLFESLNHIILIQDLGTAHFRGLPKATRYWTRRSQQHNDLGLPKVTVKLSGDFEKDDLWCQALTFFGVPVWEWRGEGIVPPEHVPTYEPLVVGNQIEVTVGDGQAFMDFYIGYLNKILSHGGRVASVARVFKKDALKYEVVEITVQADNPPVHVVELRPTGSKDTCKITVRWTPYTTAKMEFCALDVTTILDELATDAGDTGPTAKQDSVQLSILNAGGERRQVTDELLERKVRRVYRHYLREERQTEEQVLSETMHELSTYLQPVSKMATDLDKDNIGIPIKRRAQWLQKGTQILTPANRDRLRREAHTALQCVELIRTSIAIYGQRTDKADLFNGRSISAEVGVREIMGLVVGPAIRLAAIRSKRSLLLHKWDDFISEVITMPEHCRLDLGGLSFWENDRTSPKLDWRLGATSLLVTALHNAVQHFVLFIAENIGGPVPEDKSVGPTLNPPSDPASFAGLFEMTLNSEELTLRNRGKTTTTFDLQREFHRAPHTAETIRRCLSGWFCWEKLGRLNIIDATVDDPFHRTQIELPFPFWSSDDADRDL